MDDAHAKRPGRIKTAVRFLSLLMHFLFDRLVAATTANTLLMLREIDLFLGTALLAIGFFSFESDKFCDGNTADYLSCTRPSTFYYFDTLDIFLIVVGIFFILLWVLKSREARR
ncbi:MAG: hypothetical protein WAZ27_03825 [Minisyncoccia bacterium]